MKVLAADASTSESEVDVMCHIQRNGSALPGRDFVVQLIDEFVHTGPNGVHCCIRDFRDDTAMQDTGGPVVLWCPQILKSCTPVKSFPSILRKECWLRSLTAWNIYIIVGLFMGVCSSTLQQLSLTHSTHPRSSSQEYPFPFNFNHFMVFSR
jgi:hypothetical protein